MQSDSSNAGGGLLPENARQALQAQYGAEIRTDDYRGRIYGAFHARSNPWGRGFVVYGRGFGADTYSGTIIMVCATPAKPLRRGLSRRGFSTKREAQALAARMNEESLAFLARAAR
jgi:hypothetical protein